MNTIKKLMITSVAIAALTGATSQALEASAGIDAASAYIFRGATIHDDIALQPYADVELAPGLVFSTWADFNTDAGDFDEIDYLLSYTFDIDGYALGVTYNEYTFPGVEGDPDREVTLAGDVDLGTIGLDGFGFGLLVGIGFEGVLEDGLYVEASTSYGIPVDDSTTIDLGITLGSEWGDNVDENGLSYLQLGTGGSFMDFAVGVAYIVELDDEILAVDEDFLVTVGYSF